MNRNIITVVVLLAVVALGGLFIIKNGNRNVAQIPADSQLAQVAPTSGLIGYWKFDEGSGIMASDSSGNGYNGTLTNNPSWVSGNIAGALNFSSASGQSVNTNSDIQGTGTITMCAWIKPATIQSYGNIITNGKTILAVSSAWGNKLYLSSDGGAIAAVVSDAQISTGSWTHVCGVRNSGGTGTLYINGSQNGPVNGDSGIPSAGSLSTSIGARANGLDTFDGSIDEVRIYNRALSASEVSAVYAYTGVSIPPPPPSDTTPPVISGITASSITTGGATISWSVNEPASSVVKYGITTGYGSSAAPVDNTTTSLVSRTLSGLTPNSVYHYQIQSTDTAGNPPATSADQTFTTASSGNQLPIVSVSASSATGIAPATITISATASDPDGTIKKVEFYNGSTLLATDTGSPYSYSWKLVTAGTYTITAKATDNLGAVSTSSPVSSTVVGKFNVGDKVQVTGASSIAIRSTPSTKDTNNKLGTQPRNALGTVLEGPIVANGYAWWNINYDTGVDGWSVDKYLTKISTAPVPTYTVTTTKTGTGTGTVTCSPSCTVNAGSSVTLTESPSTDSLFSAWSTGPCAGTSTTTCVFTPTVNTSVNAVFTLKTVTQPPTASLSASPTSITAGNPSTLSWSSTNATSCSGTGFNTSSATSGTVTVTPTATTTYSVSCTGAGGTDTKSVTVTVSPVVTYTLTPSAGSNGTISPSSVVTVTSGGSQTFTITPNSGYQISSVTVDGVSVGTVSSYTFSNVTANHTISATFSAVVAGQYPWSGIIDPTRAVDWRTSGAIGGIPSASWPNCTTAECNTLYGGSVTASTINVAVNSAPANSVVRIPSGSFSVGAFNITKSNVVLRGAGANQTKLNFTSCQSGGGLGGTNCPAIHMMSGATGVGSFGGVTSANWTGSYAKDATTITLSNTSGLTAGPVGTGSLIMLDQLQDSADGWPVKGDVYSCTSNTDCSNKPSNLYARSGRPQIQVVTVTGINGNQVSISPGLAYPNWRSDRSPGAYWNTGSPLHNTGLEDLAVNFTNDGGNGVYVINSANVWIKGVSIVSTNTTKLNDIYHIFTLQSAHLTIRSNYFYGPVLVYDPNNFPYSNYVYSDNIVSDVVFENNVCHHNVDCMIPSFTNGRNVFGYNYVDNNYAGVAGIQTHSGNIMMDLFEGNNIQTFYSDVTHGSHNFLTIFRNHFDGGSHNDSQTAGMAIALMTNNRFFNLIGNVIGASGYTGYESTLSSGGGNTAYSLGWQGNNSNDAGQVINPDTNVKRTLLRWGNWDQFTSTGDTATNDQTGTRWVTSEVPSAIANFANQIPSTQSLPASMYLSSKPSWFGSVAFPAIGPDVSGGTAPNTTSTPTGGHANKIPSRVCFESTGNDTSYSASPAVKAFNATNCYGQ